MYRKTSIAVAILSALLSPLMSPMTSSAASVQESHRDDSEIVAMSESDILVNYAENGKIGCREATPAEAAMVLQRDPDLKLQEISVPRSEAFTAQASGLTITLRGTPQLENFPQARQAFLRAAARWQSLIQNPLNIIVDVDFGPTNFGVPFPEGRLGNTRFQNTGNLSWYPQVREKLIAGAATPETRALYNSLPLSSVPTELGDTAAVFGPATMFRALGLLSPVANPDQEVNLGAPPSIGFNSAYAYDFDPSDGIDSDKTDFEALAEHEMGHVLGFFSMSGNRENFPDAPVGVSVWDLFRFRPGITMGAFPTAPRALHSGGEQVFFTGGPELQLSTGRGDYTGGDMQQPHHWKANELSGKYIGIMDPTFGDGERMEITENDLEALETIGYQIARPDRAPIIDSLSASLDGDILSLTGTASDADGDMAQAQVNLLDAAGQVVAKTPPFAVDFASVTTSNFKLTVSNLSAFPMAVRASLTVIDRKGNHSAARTADFSRDDAGRPTISSASYNGNKLIIKGNGFANQVVIEINGRVVSLSPSIDNRKLKVKGSPDHFNLHTGSNLVQVLNGNLRSNLFVLNF